MFQFLIGPRSARTVMCIKVGIYLSRLINEDRAHRSAGTERVSVGHQPIIGVNRMRERAGLQRAKARILLITSAATSFSGAAQAPLWVSPHFCARIHGRGTNDSAKLTTD